MLRKLENERYRELAAELTSTLGGQVHHMASVNRDANNSGAFIEVTIWIPRHALRGFEGPCQHCCNGSVLDERREPQACPVCLGDSRQ